MKQLILLTASVLLLLTVLAGCTIVVQEPENQYPADESLVYGGDFAIKVQTDENGNQVIIGGNITNQIVVPPEDTDAPDVPDVTEDPDVPVDTQGPVDTQDATACTNHSFGSWTVTRAASCSQTGSKTLTCTSCGHQETETIAKNDHAWQDATCTEPRRCSSCGTTDGSALSHTGGIATCEHGKICVRCGTEYTSIGDHEMVDATCTSGEYCSSCGKTFGSALGHSYSGDSCSRCGKSVPVSDFVPSSWYPLLISGGRVTSCSYAIDGDTILVTVNGYRTLTTSGVCKFSWTVYGGGYTIIESGNYTTGTLAGNESFSVTVSIPNVITSKFSSYEVYISLPN